VEKNINIVEDKQKLLRCTLGQHVIDILAVPNDIVYRCACWKKIDILVRTDNPKLIETVPAIQDDTYFNGNGLLCETGEVEYREIRYSNAFGGRGENVSVIVGCTFKSVNEFPVIYVKSLRKVEFWWDAVQERWVRGRKPDSWKYFPPRLEISSMEPDSLKIISLSPLRYIKKCELRNV